MEYIVRKIRELELFSAAYIMGLRIAMLAGKFLLGLFIVRFIGLEAMGVYGLVTGATAIVPMMVRLGIFSSLSRLAVNQPLEELTKNLRHYGYGCFFLYLVLLPFTIGAGVYFNALPLALLAFFIIIFEHLCMDIFVLANNLHRPRLANELLSLQSATWIYLYMILAWMIPAMRSLDVVFAFWIMGGLIPTCITTYLTRDWPWKLAFAEKISFGWYKMHFTGAWRIYLSDMIGVIAIYLDRYLINIFLNLEMVGIYVLFWQVINAICNLVGAGVLQVYRPRLIAVHHERDEARFRSLFWQSAYKSLGITLGMAIGSAIVVPYLIGYTKQPMALDYMPLFWLMLFSLLFRMAGDICSYTLFAQHRDDLGLQIGLLKLFSAAVIGTLSLITIGIYSVPLTTAITGGLVVLYTANAWNGKRSIA